MHRPFGLANPVPPDHICLMAKTAVAIALLALLSVSLWYAYGLWTSLEDTALPTGLYVAMGGGVLFSLLVGVGLMGLVFYSSRHGYDDRAANTENQNKE